jgi:hypothetical protein
LKQSLPSARAVDGLQVTLRTQFARLDGSHPDSVPVPNEHIVHLQWFRMELDVAFGIGAGWC